MEQLGPFLRIDVDGDDREATIDVFAGPAAAVLADELGGDARLIGVLSASFGIGAALGMAVLAIKPFLRQIPADTLAWLLGGGLAYTLGTVFYMSRRIPFAHAIWHGFVLLGSACHFVAVTHQVVRG